MVDPPSTVPYLISVCFARSSADSIGDCILSTVRKAARLAVYDEMMMRVKNHHTLPTMRPDIDLELTQYVSKSRISYNVTKYPTKNKESHHDDGQAFNSQRQENILFLL